MDRKEKKRLSKKYRYLIDTPPNPALDAASGDETFFIHPQPERRFPDWCYYLLVAPFVFYFIFFL